MSNLSVPSNLGDICSVLGVVRGRSGHEDAWLLRSLDGSHIYFAIAASRSKQMRGLFVRVEMQPIDGTLVLFCGRKKYEINELSAAIIKYRIQTN